MNKFMYLFILLFCSQELYGQSMMSDNHQSTLQLTLTGAIEIGLKNNPMIRASRAKVDATKGKFWSGISLPPPEISASYEYIPNGTSINNFSEKTVGISQSFEFPSNYFFRGQRLLNDKDIAEAEYSISELSVLVNVKSAYFQTLANQELLKNATENLALAEDFSRKSRIRYSAGEGTNLEQLTAKVQYTEAMNAVETQKNHLASAYAELNSALGFGKEQSHILQLSDSLRFVRLNFQFDTLLNDAFDINPQLRTNRLRVSSSSYDRLLAWSGILPSFSVSYFHQSRDGINSFYGASVGISVPLWFLVDQRGKIQETTANVSVAESELQSAQNSVYLRLQNSFTEYKNQEQQALLYQTEILPQAEEIYRTALRSYEAGEITYIEFLQAKQTRIASRTNYINVLLSYHLSIVSLEVAVGKRLY